MGAASSDTHIQIGRTGVEIVDADIVTLEVDAIVCSANTHMFLAGEDSVAGALLKATDGKIVDELKAFAREPVPIGGAVVTSGAGLPCKHVIHVATHGTLAEEHAAMKEQGIDDDVTFRLKVIGDCVAEAVEQASASECRSLALPMLATGALGFSRMLAVDALVKGILSALAASKYSIDNLLLVTYGDANAGILLRQALESLGQDASMAPAEILTAADIIKWGVAGATSAALLGVVGGARVPLRAIPSMPSVSPGVLHGLLRGPFGMFPAPVGVGGAIRVSRALLKGPRALKKAATVLYGLRHRRDRGDVRSEELPPESTELEKLTEKLITEVINLKELVRSRDEEIASLRARLQNLQGSIPMSELLPLPVAYAASMVETASEPLSALENLRKALSILLRYFASIALAEYHESRCFDSELNAVLRDAFSGNLSDGGWLMISNKVSHSFLVHGEKPTYFEGLTDLWHQNAKHWAPLLGSLDKLVQLRNEIHESGMMDESSAKAWLEKALPLWRSAIEQARPLFEHRLLYVETLRDFADDEGKTARYAVRWLVGEHFVPRSEEVEWRSGLRRGRLYLTGPKNPNRFLLVSPFLEYEHCNITRAREVCSFERCDEDQVVLSTFRFPFRFKPEAARRPGFFDGR